MSARSEGQRFVAGVAGKPCSTNRMWQRARQGHVYLADAAAAWELAVVADVRRQMDTHALHKLWRADGERHIAVCITFYGVRGDVDNYGKTTLDGLKKAIGIDDRYFAPVCLHLGERKRANGKLQPPGARIEITLSAQEAQEGHAPHAPIPLPTPDDEPPDLPPAATQAQTDEPTSVEDGDGWRLVDLVDEELQTRLRQPVRRVTIWPADTYDSIVVMFPPSDQADSAEWGAFIPLEHARQLRDLLNALPELRAVGSAVGSAGVGGERVDKR